MTDYAAHIGEIAKRLFGEPNKSLSNATEWRFGSRGSLSIKINGPHRGTWHDHEREAGGGVLDLVILERGGNRKDAAQWLAAEMGIGNSEPVSQRREVATYPYEGEDGEMLFEVVRFEPKDFRQRRPDGKGGHIWNLKGARMVPYRLPDIAQALASDLTVFIVEGEKDANRLWDLRIPATCNPGGAGKWRDEYSRHFANADVVIVPDNDEAGRDHAEKVARSLHGTASRVRVLDLVNLPRKGDISDWLDSGATFEDFHALVENTPTWQKRCITRLPGVWYGDEDNGPTLSWLVKDLLIDGGLSTVFGGPGTSKTFLALDLALHIAHGREWFGRKVTQGGVVYVTGEGSTGFRQRMKAWRQEKAGESRVPFRHGAGIGQFVR